MRTEVDWIDLCFDLEMRKKERKYKIKNRKRMVTIKSRPHTDGEDSDGNDKGQLRGDELRRKFLMQVDRWNEK